MGLRFLCALLPLATAMAQNPLGPTVYLADLHEVGEGTILHWKANIARPEFSNCAFLMRMEWKLPA